MVWGSSNVVGRIACKYSQKCRRQDVLEQLKAGDGGDFVGKSQRGLLLRGPSPGKRMLVPTDASRTAEEDMSGDGERHFTEEHLTVASVITGFPALSQ